MKKGSLLAGAFCVVLLLGSACSTVGAIRDQNSRVRVDPDFTSEHFSFFFGTVSASNPLVLENVCLGKEVDQITVGFSALDALATVFTLGIYVPRTIRVWCSI